MSSELIDRVARDRFCNEWERNFAVSANAGSGKTTAISERLAAIALAPGGADRLRKTAVVTYTKKAAAEIEQRARKVLLRRVTEGGTGDLAALDHLERAFFGTIHSFCLKLAQTYGQTVGINLNPDVVAEDDEALWEEFLEQDAMTFAVLPPPARSAFLRHMPLEQIFPLARQLNHATARDFIRRPPAGALPQPDTAALARLLQLPAKGRGADNVLLSQARACAWQQAWECRSGFLPLFEPAGNGQAVGDCASAWMAPLKRWLATVAAALAGELAERYRAWRFARGVQTYADQIDAAMAVLHDDALLDRVRAEGWRVILDEAQDTDPQQFAVLVEIARPPGAPRGTWPAAEGAAAPGPRAGHFCLVGDGQQAIYGSRADIGNFMRHIEAFRRGDSGELLEFEVTFRAPHRLIETLNATLPAAFGPAQRHNFGLPPADGAPPPFLQVPYVALQAGPLNVPGAVLRLPLEAPQPPPAGVEAWLRAEARQVAAWLKAHGPAALAADNWGEVAVLAPRNEWLVIAQKAFEEARLEVALQTRRSRCGDNPAYAWLTGLLAVCADPDNMFEWTGVLREVFGVSDGVIAAELRAHGKLDWEEPSRHPAPLAGAMSIVRPFVLAANDDGYPLGTYVRGLADAAALRARCARLDPGGGLEGELDRLLAQADNRGLAGTTPRAWLEELLGCIDDGRPSGKPTSNAINLLTSHSAKGLEWPVVIVLGLWRGIGQPPERGLRLVRDTTGTQVYFDSGSLPDTTRESRDRERVRELTRLLYVTLTRARRTLVVPWADDFGGRQREHPSFAELWDAPLGELPAIEAGTVESGGTVEAQMPARQFEDWRGELPPGVALPARVLPHQLAEHPDIPRLARHESGLDLPLPAGRGEEAIEYGVWWHTTMESLPWGGSDAAIGGYIGPALREAVEKGFGERAAAEWDGLRRSAPWRELTDARWTRCAELSVFAPLRHDAWIDGVMDLVLHDPARRELWIVDWKTNHPRRGESSAALLARLAAEYRPQLSAYAQSAAVVFPGMRVRALVYSSAAGAWWDVAPEPNSGFTAQRPVSTFSPSQISSSLSLTHGQP